MRRTTCQGAYRDEVELQRKHVMGYQCARENGHIHPLCQPEGDIQEIQYKSCMQQYDPLIIDVITKALPPNAL